MCMKSAYLKKKPPQNPESRSFMITVRYFAKLLVKCA